METEEKKPDISAPESVKRIEVLEVRFKRGGCGFNAVRTVAQYWTPDGKLLVEKDPAPE